MSLCGAALPLGYGFPGCFDAGTNFETRTSGAKALTVSANAARLKPCPSFAVLTTRQLDRVEMAYAGNVVSSSLRRTFPAMTTVLVLALLLTQAASTVCTAQCVQRQLPETPTHCHSMLHACPHANNATAETARACDSSLCGMDLLAGNHDRSLAQQRPPAACSDSYGSRPGLNIASFSQTCASLRSSVGGPPMITALRV
jgi:hypothetical protein